MRKKNAEQGSVFRVKIPPRNTDKKDGNGDNERKINNMQTRENKV